MNPALLLHVVSTFDCTAIDTALRRTVVAAGIADAIGFTPPSQLCNYMLAPSIDSEDALGTVVFVRIEDWLRADIGSFT